MHQTYGPLELWQWLGLPVAVLGAILVALLVQTAVLFVAGRIARLTAVKWDDELVAAGRGPLAFLIGAVALAGAVRALALPAEAEHGFYVLSKILAVASICWFLLRISVLGSALMLASVGDGNADVRARSVRTQIVVLRRFFVLAVWVISLALVLMQFEVVRNVGVSLLASAGIAGLVIGLAAQKTIGTLLAGLQLSITQPIRIGDTVVVETQFGVIEEIRLTYVVVRVWDLRRLVVPITYFLDKPFENWTRGASELLGTVTLEVDYLADVDAFRAELGRILAHEGKALWDGKTQSLSVTETVERAMTLRVLVSSSDPGANWDLRCLIRERLVRFLQRHPQWLPTRRTEARNSPGPKPLER